MESLVNDDRFHDFHMLLENHVQQLRSTLAKGEVAEIEIPQKAFDFFLATKGEGESESFTYKNVRLFPKGKMKEIKEREGRTMSQIMHGSQVVGGQNG